MKRADVIQHLRYAGYHGDRAAFTRLCVETRISYQAAKKAYGEGQAARSSGVKCICHDCNSQDHGKEQP